MGFADGAVAVFYPFENGHFGGVATAATELDDAGVAAIALGKAGGDVLKENADHVLVLAPFVAPHFAAYAVVLGELVAGLLLQSRGHKSAALNGAILLLSFFAEGDHFIGHHAGGFCLGEGGADATVFDEAAHEVGEQRGAVLTGAAKFGGTFAVAHSAC